MPDRRHLAGIYVITNLRTGQQYVGQSTDLYGRWQQHKHELSKNRHHSHALQRAWNLAQEKDFEFRVLQYCDEKNLEALEQKWIKKLLPAYNVGSRNRDLATVTQGRIERKLQETNPPPRADDYTKPGETFTRPRWHLWVYGSKPAPR